MIIKEKKHKNQKKKKKIIKKTIIISYVLVQSQLPSIMCQDGLLVFVASSSGIMN